MNGYAAAIRQVKGRVVVNMIRKWVLFYLLFMVIFPQQVFSHAQLENANPAPNSQLPSSPADITLTFNERLERELYYIKVFDSHGEPITENRTEMSQDQKKMHLSLPPLDDGLYTVTYRVISSDGHPIRGSYVISVGGAALSVPIPHYQEPSFITFAIRILYFVSLLLISGWMAWSRLFASERHRLEPRYQQWTSYFQWSFLFSLLAMTVVQLGDLLSDWNFQEIPAVMFHTATGLSMTISLFLSLVGFFILLRNKWVDLGWVLFLLAAKSISGHAMAAEPPVVTVLLDLIHLLAASLWVGGLGFLMIFWRSHQEAIKRFLPVFSKTALVSIIVLVITGTLTTVMFLPKLSYLFETTWGNFLLAKIVLVALVICVGAILRKRIKKTIDPISTWLKVDLALMILILSITGIFTYLSPLPANQPLSWHEESASTHRMTTQITPNAPGNNHFSVQVSVTEKHLHIKQVELFLSYKDDPDIAPIKVPLVAERVPSEVVEYQFTSAGPYLPLAGNWLAEVRIMDSEDNETVYTKNFTIYQIN